MARHRWAVEVEVTGCYTAGFIFRARHYLLLWAEGARSAMLGVVVVVVVVILVVGG